MTFYVLFHHVTRKARADAVYFRAHYFCVAIGPNAETEFYYAYYDAETNELLHKGHVYKFSSTPAGTYSWVHDPCGTPIGDIYPKTKIRFVIYCRYTAELSAKWFKVVEDVFNVTWDGIRGQGTGNPVRIFHLDISSYRFLNPTPALNGKPVLPFIVVLEQDVVETRTVNIKFKDKDTGNILANFTISLTKARDTLYGEMKGIEPRMYHIRCEISVNAVISDYVDVDVDASKTYSVCRFPRGC